jgi:hypothetical protein
MIRSLAIAAAAMAFAVAPAAGNASVKVCWINGRSRPPGFANLGTAGFFVKASLSEDYPPRPRPGNRGELSAAYERSPLRGPSLFAGKALPQLCWAGQGSNLRPWD